MESKAYHISHILVLTNLHDIAEFTWTPDRISICIYQIYDEILFKVLKCIRQQSST